MSNRERHMQSAAVFVILRKGERVLLLQRMATGWMDGQFSVPAGALDAGETIKTAAIRETLEEVGTIVHPHDAIHAHTMHCKTGSATWMGHFFVVESWQGEPHICEPDKHTQVLWCEVNTLPDNLIPYVRQALDLIKQGVNYSVFGWV
jgi:8-oxo-dGTP pyrophosphatase MutT (NUDIX family)